MISLEVNNVTKIFPDGTKALDDVSFSLNSKEAVVMLGHNGSGKSTLFKCMAGFEKPTSGSIHIGDASIDQMTYQQLRPIRKKVGMVFQHFHLINNLSVFQNVLFGALGSTQFTFQTFAPLATGELREKAMSSLERVGLADFARRRADQLSGGQKQRVAIARMLMQDPEIVLADEPIASLDPRAGREVMDLLWDIVAEKDLTVVCVLHQMNIAEEYGSRIIALKQGKVVADDHIDALDEDFLEDLYLQEQEMKIQQEKSQKGVRRIETVINNVS